MRRFLLLAATSVLASTIADAQSTPRARDLGIPIEGTSEAILNAMLAAETMTGANGLTMFALPHARLVAVLRKYGRVR